MVKVEALGNGFNEKLVSYSMSQSLVTTMLQSPVSVPQNLTTPQPAFLGSVLSDEMPEMLLKRSLANSFSPQGIAMSLPALIMQTAPSTSQKWSMAGTNCAGGHGPILLLVGGYD